MKSRILRYGALTVVMALMLAVCWPCAVSASEGSPDGICTLDLCSKGKSAVTGADLTISEPAFSVQIPVSADALYQIPQNHPESVVASPPLRPPVV